MMDNDGGTFRAVAWSELFPWLTIFRCFRLAIGFRVLLISAVAALATVSGWAVIAWVLRGDPEIAPYQGCPWTAVTSLVPNQPGLPDRAGYFGVEDSSIFQRSPEPFLGTWEQLGRPFRRIFKFGLDVGSDSGAGSGSPVAKATFLLLCGLWALAIWAFFGGAVTRVAAVQLACEERVGWGGMMRYACSKWRAYFTAPLVPLLGVLGGSLVIGLFGLLLRSNVSVLIAAIVWPLLLAGAVLMALLLLGLLFGWPLMFPTISAEGTDSFDALSRSYAYVFQRPLHYLFYTIVAVVLGVLGWLLVSNFAAATISLTYWATGWGAGGGGFRLEPESIQEVQYFFANGEELKHVGWFGGKMIAFWCGCVKLLAVGFLYSYFWTASTAIYFLLRRDVDATEMDEVFLEDEEDEPSYGLPPLETDDAGAPEVADDAESASGE